MKTISVMLASSKSFRNTGMFSVDYAAYEFFKTNFPDCDIKFYVFHLSRQSSYPYEELMPYSIYNKVDEYNIYDIQTSDLIIYWSDFFHTRHFLEQYMEDYVFSNSKNAAVDKDLFIKMFFLHGARQSSYAKTIAFGNSMMFLDEEETFRNDEYSNAMLNLYSEMRVSMPRDYISYSKVRGITDARCEQGCDPAFLLSKTDGINFNEPKLGLFIGRRTKIRLRDVFETIKFARQNKLKIEWINWMINTESFFMRALKHPSQAKNLLIHCILSFIFGNKKDYYENDFTTLGKYSIIVTDTYHLAINALKEDVSVFCIGDTTNHRHEQLDLHDKKKEVLFRMLCKLSCYGKITSDKLNFAIKQGKYTNSIHKHSVGQIRHDLIQHCAAILARSRN